MGIELLPTEVIERILGFSFISMQDVMNFSLTCKRFKDLLYNDYFLKLKLLQIYELPSSTTTNLDWRSEWIFIYTLSTTMQSFIKETINIGFTKHDFTKTECKHITKYLDQNPNTFFYIEKILTDDFLKQDNLTFKYFANKLYMIVKYEYLSKEWKKILSRPVEEHILEDGMMFVSKWCEFNSYKVESYVKNKLDSVANYLREIITSSYKDHPLNKFSEEEMNEWKTKTLTKNMYNGDDCIKAIKCINNVLFNELKYDCVFQGGLNLSVSLHTNKATGFVLRVIYESIARRLGIKCDILAFEGHLLLKWRDNSPGSPPFYIVLENNGRMKRADCPYSRMAQQRPVTLTKVALISADEMVTHSSQNNTNRSYLELVTLVDPTMVNAHHSLFLYYYEYSLNLSELRDNITQIVSDYPQHRGSFEHSICQELDFYSMAYVTPNVVPKIRKNNVRYAVGMLMFHLKFNYIGVIYGWDEVCAATEDWKRSMGVNRLKKKDKQPFYHVLVTDCSQRYVAQENIQAISYSNAVIGHPELGCYFERYMQTHYKPNHALSLTYPEDQQVLDKIIDEIENPKD